MENHPKHLFVYGTLKRGLCRAFALAGQTFVGDAATRPLYRMYNCGTYPGLVKSHRGLSIRGELWIVDEGCLDRLDEIEGVAENQYQRESIDLLHPYQQQQVEAYFYRYDISGLADCGDCW